MAAAPAPLIPSSAATRLPDGAALSGVNGPVIDGMQASPTVPSASLLQYGTYDRVGNDLVIHGPAGEQVVVENYFRGNTPATLHAPGGFELAGKTVMALAGEHVPVQVADAGGNQQLAQAASPIGTADKLSGTVTVTRVDGSVVTLQAGDVVYQGDVLQTADGSSIGLVMADGTELSLGSKGRIVLDEMVYDAGNGTGHSSVSLVSGVFSFVSGQIAKSSPDGMQIKTPVATIGIRGTSGTIQLGDLALDNDSQIRVILIPDPNGTVGEIQITTMDGRTSTLNTAFNGLNIGQSTLQSFTMTVHDFVGQYGSVIQNLRSDFSSSLGPINNTAPEQNNTPQNNTPAPGENKGSDASGTDKDSTQQASSSSGTDGNQNAQDSSSAPIKVVLTDTIVTKTTTSAFATTTDNDTQTTGGSSGSSTGSSSTGQSGSTGTSTGSVFNNTDNSLNSSTNSGGGTSGGSTGSGSSGGDSSSVSYNGSVIDPHVSGATVFIDYDGDGILDSNEPHTITASDGSYSLTDSLGIGGQVVSVGGIDTVTGLSIGTLTAPSGSSTVTPLTTLMQNLISSGAASSASQAQSLVASALGLNLSSINLTNYDPVTQLSGSSATQASLILSTGVMVQNVVAMITATLVGAGASESSALEAAFTALATAMDGASGRSFLQDPSAISSIISDAASDSSLSGTIDASKVAAAQTAVAQTISSLSAAMETIISSGGNATALLADLSAAARVAQRDAQADIAAAVADGTAESLSNTYSSSSIASLIAQAKEEEVSTSGPIEGTSGNDSLTGTSGADDIQGNDGNDWLSGGAGNDRLYGGNGNDTLLGGSGNDLLNGGSGIDTADYSDSTAALTVNLATGSASSSEVGTDTLSSIEVVIGGSGNDSFTGGSGAETFFGGAGNDTFIASAGDDVLNGGDGTDTLDFSAVSAAVTVNLASGAASSTATGSDSLSSIEVVIGGSGNDSFTGGSGAETFFGGAGNDTFIASAGDDVLNGGDGTDTLDFSAVSAAVTVNLATGTASSTATGSDSLSSIEVVIGGSGNDSFTGGSGAETFFGGAGNDTFIASAGDDVLNGGDGTDTLDFSAVSAAVTVNLATGTASSTATGSDSLSSIEVVIGGSGNDSFTGGSGAETFFGGAGNDTFIASAGDDVLNGGDGTDTLDFGAVSAAVTVNLATGTASSTATGSDSLSSIEVVIGGSGDDTFTGGSGAETFSGGAGDDTFIASAGDDVLNGGDGTDTVDYGNTKVALTVNLANGTASSSESGSDSLSSIEKVIGGSGNDSLTGSSGADTLLGGDGSDTLIGNGGADVLSGGSGNDTLTYTGSEVSLDGGDGSDRLLLNAGSSVALSSLVGVVSNIEIIDLGNHETTLTVTADDVSSLIGGSDWFIVDGGSSDVLALSGEWLSGDIITVDGVTYDSYVQDGTLILVGQDLTVEQIIPAVGEVLNVEGSSVLAGTYIHLGIGSDGYLGVGSGVVSETGWETASGGLSMAVDTDGFNQGDASATGDYFLPGTPVEGYSIGYVTTSGTTVLSAHYPSSAAVNGSTSAEIDGTDLVATTTATSSDGALSISQVITLGSDATYYTTTVTLTNLTESTMSSVRYMRNADPDMDFDLHRTYLSVNDVLANPSDSGVAAVQASGPVSGDHVLYFSDSSSARASANGFENTNPYAGNVYGSPSDPNGSSDDIGINMVIDGGTLAPGASVTISYVTSLNVASNGHDFLVGTSAANVLDGGNGNDILWGLGGADTLLGGNGSDTLIGGLGNDLLTGGNGPDTFLFTAGVGDTTAARIASLGTDVISDFTHGVDSLVLDGETFNLGEAFAYLEQGSSLSDTAVSFGTGSGVIVVGSDSGEGGVELWFTTDSSAATTSNSYQIATLQHADLSTVSQSDIHVG